MNAASRVALFCSVACFMAQATHGETLVASNYTPTFVPSGFRSDIGYTATTNGGFTNTRLSQRFVAEHRGEVTAIEFAVRNNSASTPLLVSLRADFAGLPGASLGEVSVPSSQVPGSYISATPGDSFVRTRVDLTPLAATVEAGVLYHVILRTATAKQSGPGQYSTHQMRPHADSFNLEYLHNRGGTASWTDSAFGLEFPIAVFAIIPEPGAVWLVLMMAGGVASARRR